MKKFKEALLAIDDMYERTYLTETFNIIEDKDIPFELETFKLNDAIGVTLNDKILINKDFVERVMLYPNDNNYYTLIFCIFHEIAHFQRIARHKYITDDLNTSIFNIFFDTIQKEENIANRYGLMMFRKLVGRDCYEIKHMFEKLYDDESMMRTVYSSMFMALRSTDMNYFEFTTNYVIKSL